MAAAEIISQSIVWSTHCDAHSSLKTKYKINVLHDCFRYYSERERTEYGRILILAAALVLAAFCSVAAAAATIHDDLLFS